MIFCYAQVLHLVAVKVFMVYRSKKLYIVFPE